VDVDYCTKFAVPPDEYRVEGAREGAMQISRKLDLDGDDYKDAWVTAPQFCNILNDCVYALYVLNEYQVAEKCGWYIGLTSGSEFSGEIFEQRHLRNFQAANLLGRYGGGFAIVRYRFNGKEYVGAEQQICLAYEGGDRCGQEAPLGDVPLPPEGWDQPYP